MIIRFLEAPAQNIRNGNVVTSERWRSLFEDLGHRVVDARHAEGGESDIVVVFNAYKNRQAIRDARTRGGTSRIVVCLTGTDLYQDLKGDPDALDVLELADQLVVLQPMALRELPPAVREKTMVIFQSAVAPVVRPARENGSFDVCVIAHLREIKDPFRTARASGMLPPESRIRILHVGKALSEAVALSAEREFSGNPRYHWLGEQSGARTAEILMKSRLLVVTSLFEGGANVVSEALVCEVPVIGSDMGCMRGLLGEDYPGLFPVGDTRALAGLLLRAETDERFYQDLAERCRNEAHKFDPALERESLRVLIDRVTG